MPGMVHSRETWASKSATSREIYSASVNAHLTGVPVMRAMVLEFPGDISCEDLDRQYMLGDSLLSSDGYKCIFFEKGYYKKYTDALSGWKNLVPLSEEEMEELTD